MKTTIAALMLFWGTVLCSWDGGGKMPQNAIYVQETTVATVNGWRVGGGNYMLENDPSGRRRPSVHFAIWKPGSKDVRSRSITLFQGDVFDVGGKKYRVYSISLAGGKNGNGVAVIVPAK